MGAMKELAADLKDIHNEMYNLSKGNELDSIYVCMGDEDGSFYHEGDVEELFQGFETKLREALEKATGKSIDLL